MVAQTSLKWKQHQPRRELQYDWLLEKVIINRVDYLHQEMILVVDTFDLFAKMHWDR